MDTFTGHLHVAFHRVIEALLSYMISKNGDNSAKISLVELLFFCKHHLDSRNGTFCQSGWGFGIGSRRDMLSL